MNDKTGGGSGGEEYTSGPAHKERSTDGVSKRQNKKNARQRTTAAPAGAKGMIQPAIACTIATHGGPQRTFMVQEQEGFTLPQLQASTTRAHGPPPPGTPLTCPSTRARRSRACQRRVSTEGGTDCRVGDPPARRSRSIRDGGDGKNRPKQLYEISCRRPQFGTCPARKCPWSGSSWCINCLTSKYDALYRKWTMTKTDWNEYCRGLRAAGCSRRLPPPPRTSTASMCVNLVEVDGCAARNTAAEWKGRVIMLGHVHRLPPVSACSAVRACGDVLASPFSVARLSLRLQARTASGCSERDGHRDLVQRDERRCRLRRRGVTPAVHTLAASSSCPEPRSPLLLPLRPRAVPSIAAVCCVAGQPCAGALVSERTRGCSPLDGNSSSVLSNRLAAGHLILDGTAARDDETAARAQDRNLDGGRGEPPRFRGCDRGGHWRRVGRGCQRAPSAAATAAQRAAAGDCQVVQSADRAAATAE